MRVRDLGSELLYEGLLLEDLHMPNWLGFPALLVLELKFIVELLSQKLTSLLVAL